MNFEIVGDYMFCGEQEWLNKAGDQALPLLHKLAYPKCMIDFAHCHNKPCPCGCDTLCKRCSKEFVFNNGIMCEKCLKEINKNQLDLEEIIKKYLGDD